MQERFAKGGANAKPYQVRLYEAMLMFLKSFDSGSLCYRITEQNFAVCSESKLQVRAKRCF